MINKFINILIILLTTYMLGACVLPLNAVAHTHSCFRCEYSIISRIRNFLRTNYNSFIGYRPRDNLVMIVAM